LFGKEVKVTARLSKPNYRFVNQQGKEFVVRLNYMKRAIKEGIWKAKERERCNGKHRTRQPGREEDEQVEIAHRPVTISVTLEGNRQQVPGSPNRSPQRTSETPPTSSQVSESREQKRDPTFLSSDILVTRRELGTTRRNPPITRLRLRLHALGEIVEPVG
jgi:hypothetical protein